ncbi:MAG: hypothetical protein GEV28_38880 [Actinophytocola sp.]|uniref:hypothetical protein n=1 Tax=Actinophytocola sp. TaxID=1872138 RepID=UPI001321B0C3|nr:hypothetical protein [Actinophytocola sp.]MPZ86020.1 hypothetical protein [Actinophytocola sp.]
MAQPSDTASPATPPDARTLRRAITASAIGNMTEWFDYGVYAYTAVFIGEAFFPSEDKTASTLGSLLVFAVAFLIRPVGGMIWGRWVTGSAVSAGSRRPSCSVVGAVALYVVPETRACSIRGRGIPGIDTKPAPEPERVGASVRQPVPACPTLGVSRMSNSRVPDVGLVGPGCWTRGF